MLIVYSKMILLWAITYTTAMQPILFNLVLCKIIATIRFIYILACQRGGVSEEPPLLRATTRHGPLILSPPIDGLQGHWPVSGQFYRDPALLARNNIIRRWLSLPKMTESSVFNSSVCGFAWSSSKQVNCKIAVVFLYPQQYICNWGWTRMKIKRITYKYTINK